MADGELTLEESDARRREQLAAAEEAVLALVQEKKPSSPQELRNTLAHADLGLDQAILRTAVLRLLSQGRLFGERRTAAAAQ